MTPAAQAVVKTAGDVVSVTIVGATMMQVLPPVAALLTVIWSAIRIYETRTVQKCLGRDPHTRSDDESKL